MTASASFATLLGLSTGALADSPRLQRPQQSSHPHHPFAAMAQQAVTATADAVKIYSYGEAFVYLEAGCVPGCDDLWISDGECDVACNVPACQFDGPDCFSGTRPRLSSPYAPAVRMKRAVEPTPLRLRAPAHSPRRVDCTQELASATRARMAPTTAGRSAKRRRALRASRGLTSGPTRTSRPT